MDNMQNPDKSTHELSLDEAQRNAQKAIRAIQNQTIKDSVQNKDPYYFPHRPVGKTGAVLNTVFGSILTAGFGIPVAITALAGVNPVVTFGLSLPLMAGVAMGLIATREFKRISRYKRYLSLFKGSNFCFVEELADYSGYSQRFVTKDLRKMLQRGNFPHAHLTQDNSLILLTKDSYERYIFEQRRRKLLGEGFQEKEDVLLISENNSTLTEGREFIRQVNQANLKILDSDVKGKISRLEGIIRQIIEHVEKHPEQVGNLRRFIQYYMPSVVKLLTVYQELERHTIEGEHISTTKEEIKGSLDSINAAFEKLFNNLFAGISIDISTDIAVLNTLLEEDGLTKSEFKL